MTKYDDASWHYEGDFPADLPPEHGATHIGMLLTWCIQNDFFAQELSEELADEVQAVKNRSLTGTSFLLTHCDGKLMEEDLNEKGNAFIRDYYDDETVFATKFQDYFSDYAQVFDISINEEYLDHNQLYRVENTWSNYDLLFPIIQERFAQWQSLYSQE
ncbi:hypothetical protein [Myroides sp. DF42-4-2]|uniref:DUF7832 domain-containing protein n=1 Tax=unclassified Myroides TaxID=2642485 RepID=UPI002574ECF5|nr:hypothetical protein [Myroides sp. DF42-4-2]MDM1407611.1 hypothetical protein [Myroides sp. DF42-4-2]